MLHTTIKNRLKMAAAALMLMQIAPAFPQKQAEIFEQFKKKPESSILPDFSYAGYYNSEKPVKIPSLPVFDVTQFGAIANDEQSDRAAIMEAVKAASMHGGGIVFFPKGRFLVNEDGEKPESMVIAGNNIVFKGSGSGQGGTELFMKNALPPTNPEQMWTTPPMFHFTSDEKDKLIGRVTSNQKAGSFDFQIDNAGDLQEGDWIMLRLQNNAPELIQSEMGNHKADSTWTSLVKGGVFVKEVHQIKSIRNNYITLRSPLAYPVAAKYKWEVYRFGHSEEVGIEDIAFVGNWKQAFVHHRSALDDSGWTSLKFSKLVNSWMQNCRFTDVNVGATIAIGANITVSNCIITGNAGHEAICNNGATNVLLAYIRDEASQFHSVGTNGPSMNTVVWRCSYPASTSFESHSSQPRNTLLDCVDGGLLDNRGGGSVQNMPNHMSNLIFWNYRQTNAAFQPFDFWPANKRYWKIPAPVLVGYHGAATSFIPDQLKYEESTGAPVLPQSLFEAQLELRLKKLPEWIKEQINTHQQK